MKCIYLLVDQPVALVIVGFLIAAALLAGIAWLKPRRVPLSSTDEVPLIVKIGEIAAAAVAVIVVFGGLIWCTR